MLEQLTLQDFEPHVGSEFRLQGAGEPKTATLSEARQLGTCSTEAGQRRPFSLLFRATSSHALSQAIYTVEHRALGTLTLFCVPVSYARGACVLEAVFT